MTGICVPRGSRAPSYTRGVRRRHDPGPFETARRCPWAAAPILASPPPPCHPNRRSHGPSRPSNPSAEVDRDYSRNLLNMGERLGDGRSKRTFKDRIYAAAARVPAALANRHRLELLDLLSQRPRTVQDVAEEAGITVANASQHLGVLARCGLVSVERRGTFAFYRASGPAVFRLLAELRVVAQSVDAQISGRRAHVLRHPGTRYSDLRRGTRCALRQANDTARRPPARGVRRSPSAGRH